MSDNQENTRAAVMKSCATCRHLAVHPDSGGRRVVRPGRAYECTAVVQLPPLPDSIARARNAREWLTRAFMAGDEGANCPTWEARQPRKA